MGVNSMKEAEKNGKFAKYKGSWIVNSLLCVLIGLALTIWPDVFVSAANYILGGIVLVVGIIYLAVSFWGNQAGFMKGFGIFFSIILICIGVFMLLQPEIVLSIFPMIVGGIIVVHGILDLKNGISLGMRKYRFWWVALIISVVTIGLGVLLLFNPISAIELAFRVIGVILIVDGGSDFWIGFQVKKNLQDEDIMVAKTEVIEVSAREK